MPGKAHRKKTSGPKAAKRKKSEKKKNGITDDEARRRNPKAFVFNSTGKAKIQVARSADKEQRRMHIPVAPAGSEAEEPPPHVVLVHGPPGVGKTTVIRALVKHWTRQDVRDVRGPVTVVSGKSRRLTFMECPQDLPGMLDAAKYADLVLLLVDGSFGFEMETFEFLNLLQTAGFPKVMGVLTHLDGFRTPQALKEAKKSLKHRFWTEIYQGAKLFYLSGMRHGKYLKREVLNLARFVSIVKFRPLAWRVAHSYVLADRLEDVTPPALVAAEPKGDRTVALYGYLRGAPWRPGARAHVAGAGDHDVHEINELPDPCPLPGSTKRRTLDDKERRIYAPMSDVGGLLFDRDAVYIDVPDWKVAYESAPGGAGPAAPAPAPGDPTADGEAMVRALARIGTGADQRLAASGISLFPGQGLVSAINGNGASRDGHTSVGGDDENDSDSESDSDEEEEESDSDSDSDAEAAAGAAAFVASRHRVTTSVRAEDGRVRRRVDFGAGDAAAVENGLSDSGSDTSGSEDGEDVGRTRTTARGGSASADDDTSDDDASDEDASGEDASDGEKSEDEAAAGLGAAARWKLRMADRVATLFAERGADISAAVYGDEREKAEKGAVSAAAATGSDSDDELFVRRGAGGPRTRADADVASPARALSAVEDCSREVAASDVVERWRDPEAVESLRDRFVTGDWEAGKARADARPEDEGEGGSDSDRDAFGDFEDVEAGVAFSGSSDPATAAAARAIRAVGSEVADEEAAARAAARAAKKAAFDAAYDEGGSKGVDGADGEGGGGRRKGRGPGADAEEEPESYFDAMKRDLEGRATKMREALAAMDATTRAALGGHPVGSYVRIELRGVPCELVDNFDPRTPLLLGSISPGEDALGYVQARIKRHRWFPRLLKTRDPLIVSLGWRRYQTVPVLALQDNNGRQRALKYSPEHMHCLATWWGARAPPGTGFAAVQRLDADVPTWRIAATGVVLAHDATTRVVKKLKLVGTPTRISKRTAFVTGMFTSELEAAKFEGASIRTVSGIRGTVKRAMRGGNKGRVAPGTYRASFEDRPLVSDIVFLRAWVAVDVPKYFNPVTNLLAPRAPPAPREPKRGRHRAKEGGDDGKRNGTKGKQDKAAIPNGKVTPGASTAGDTAPGASASGGATPGKVSADGSAETAAARSGAVPAPEFAPASRFLGARPGAYFGKGHRGLGYYRDPRAAHAANAGASIPDSTPSGDGAAADAAAAAAQAAAETAAAVGWVGMRNTAELRRAAGVAAPRNVDSLYKEVERVPRRFNPLKIPKNLQAALPFKSKPKLEAPRKRKNLEQRRAVVLEPEEKKKVTLVSQLQAIRNAKAETRRVARAKHEQSAAKKQAVEDAWRLELKKEERKKRYILQGQAEKRAKTSHGRDRGD